MTQPSYETTARILRFAHFMQNQPNGMVRLVDVPEAISGARADAPVHRNTIKRYITSLNGLAEEFDELPMVERVMRDGYLWLKLTRKGSTPLRSLYQYAAVQMAMGPLRVLDGEVLGSVGLEVLHHIEENIDKPTANQIKKSFYYRPFGPKDYSNKDYIFDQVVRSTLKKHVIFIKYNKADAQKIEEYNFCPWMIFIFKDGLYNGSDSLKSL